MAENTSLNSNISYITEEITRVRSAYELRENQYKEIETENDRLRKEFETIEQNPSQDEKDWLDQTIPAAIDNTIPY
jgi:predicted nuclease with TOPRIM domain